MNPIPTKHIDGDVTVGRHVTAGGNATVRGSVKVGHDMKVEGWLDAPNIKGPDKGLFADVASLQAAYPTPEKGWWAAVGAGFPASVYIESNGSWIDSGKKWQPNISADSIVGDVENLKDRVENNESSISSLTETTKRTSKSLSDLSAKHQTDVEAMRSSIAQIENQHQSDVNGLSSSITRLENQHHADSNGLSSSITQLENKEASDVSDLRSSIAKIEKDQQSQDTTTASIKSELNATTAIVYKLDEAFYAFDGFCNGTAEAWKRLGAGIFYDQSAKRFAYHEAGAETADADDGSYGNELKGKCTYRCDGRLYRFVAGDLRAYVDQRITDQLSGEISRLESVSRHIMCFDGFVDTAEEVTSGEAIYFSIEDGAFVGDEQNSQSVDEINRTLTGRTIYLYDQNLYVFDGVERQLNRLCTIDEVRAALDAKAAILSGAIAEAKKALFIDEWNMLFGENGKYDPQNAPDDTHPFLGNGIWMTYDEAMAVVKYGSYDIYRTIVPISYASLRSKLPCVRTTIPSVLSINILNFPSLNWMPFTEVIKFCTNGTTATAIPTLIASESFSIYGNKLREIQDIITLGAKCSYIGGMQSEPDTTLTTLFIKSVGHNFNISKLSALSLESMQYLINNAANTSPITIEVHPSMYVKLTGGSGQYNLIKASNVEIDATTYVMGYYNYDDLETIKPGVKYKLTLCYQLGEKDNVLVASMTGGYGNDTGFTTKSATAIIETKVRNYTAVSNAKQVNFSFYRLPNDNDFDPNTKVLWAVCVPDDGSDTPITEWIPAISELPEAEQEAAKWRQVNKLAAARGITFITA